MKSLLCSVRLLLALLPLTAAAQTEPLPAKLRHEPAFVLQAVAGYLHIPLRAEVPTPPIYFSSSTPLTQFQDAIEPQWNFRPDVFTNAYVVSRNEIYLFDEAEYYDRMKRCMDDSLAHELTHFLQVQYGGYKDLSDDSFESQAVEVQSWFREVYCSGR